MLVKELIEKLLVCDPNKVVKFSYDGFDTFAEIDIKEVDEDEYRVLLDSSEWEPRNIQ